MMAQTSSTAENETTPKKDFRTLPAPVPAPQTSALSSQLKEEKGSNNGGKKTVGFTVGDMLRRDDSQSDEMDTT